MMQASITYDKIMQEVYLLRNSFYRDFNKKPNTVIVPYKYKYTIMYNDDFKMQNAYNEGYRLMGMDLHFNTEPDENIKVGYMLKSNQLEVMK